MTSNHLFLTILIIVLPGSSDLESCLSHIASLLFCLVFLLLSVISLNQTGELFIQVSIQQAFRSLRLQPLVLVKRRQFTFYL